MLTVAELKFLLALPEKELPQARRSEAQKKLQDMIKEHSASLRAASRCAQLHVWCCAEMGPFYSVICKELKWTEDAKLAAELKVANDEGALCLRSCLSLLYISLTSRVIGRVEGPGQKDCRGYRDCWRH